MAAFDLLHLIHSSIFNFLLFTNLNLLVARAAEVRQHAPPARACVPPYHAGTDPAHAPPSVLAIHAGGYYLGSALHFPGAQMAPASISHLSIGVIAISISPLAGLFPSPKQPGFVYERHREKLHTDHCRHDLQQQIETIL